MSDASVSRQHFSLGTTALRKKQPELARAHFLAAHTLASPIVSGHALRGLAQAALQEGQAQRALELLVIAREAYALCERSERVIHGEDTALVLDAKEGRATCWVMEVDVHFASGRFDQAQTALDTAYPLYRDLEGRRSLADLWSATARLAQQHRRWTTAGVAWQKVIAVAEAHNDRALEGMAWLRLAEVRLRDVDLSALEDCITRAEPIVDDLDDPALIARLHSVRAAWFSQRNEFEAAWESGLDALHALETVDDPRLLASTRLRMASIAQRARPAECVPLLREVLESSERRSSATLALVAHRAAQLAMDRQRYVEALLAARAEEGLDQSPHPARLVQVRALLAMEEDEAAAWLAAYESRTAGDDYPAARSMAEALGDRLPADDDTSFERVATEAIPRRDEVVVRIARQRGVPIEVLCSARGIELILDLLSESRGALAIVGPQAAVPETPTLVWLDPQDQECFAHLAEGVGTVGRGRANAVQIVWDAHMSRAHFSLHRRGTKVTLRDLGSERGTFLDGRPVVGEIRVNPGETIRAGDTEFPFQLRKVASVPTPRATIATALPSAWGVDLAASGLADDPASASEEAATPAPAERQAELPL
jgi:hypothetical protein